MHATRKLPHYFHVYVVVVLTQLPLQLLLWRFDYTGRIAKWGMILGAFDIKYLPRTAIKEQVLADLVSEFTNCPERVTTEVNETMGTQVTIVTIPRQPIWKLL